VDLLGFVMMSDILQALHLVIARGDAGCGWRDAG
jgi:hypothetical protein